MNRQSKIITMILENDADDFKKDHHEILNDHNRFCEALALSIQLSGFIARMHTTYGEFAGHEECWQGEGMWSCH